MTEFAASLPELSLFLTHIHTIEVSVWRPNESAPSPLRTLKVSDARTSSPPDRERLHRLVRQAMHDLRAVGQMEDCMQLVMAAKGGITGPNGEDVSNGGRWLVAQSMGGGKAREMSVSKEVAEFGLQPVPWGGVAARLTAEGGSAAAGDAKLSVLGRPYCLLPLPSSTGLPVHVNGFFELSSNRRDIWYGDDLVGAGKLRSD